MGRMSEMERAERAKKAENLRYKKAVARGMNLDDMRQWVWDAFDEMEDVSYAGENDDIFIDAFNGDEEEAFEFRMAFNSLSADITRFQEDMEQEWIPECFDDFFAAVSKPGGMMMGYDTVEEDYFGLSPYESELGRDEAAKRLKRMTKDELIDAAQRCFQIAVAYLGLKSRHEDLRAALDIIRAENNGLLSAIKKIEELYDVWQKSGADFKTQWEAEKHLDEIASQLPDEVWMR